MFKNPLLLTALAMTAAVALWGVLDIAGLAAFAQQDVAQQSSSRAWFIMLVASLIVVLLWLAFSPYGNVRLGADEDRPEFSTVSWLTMPFAAAMGVAMLVYGAAEPLTHFSLIEQQLPGGPAAGHAMVVTDYNWALHAWCMYAVTALLIAYYAYRKGQPGIIGTPIRYSFRRGSWSLIGCCPAAVAGGLLSGLFRRVLQPRIVPARGNLDWTMISAETFGRPSDVTMASRQSALPTELHATPTE